MRKSKEEMYTELVSSVFFITGVLLLVFAGYELDRSFLLSFILLIMGTLCLLIRIEYTKEESAE